MSIILRSNHHPWKDTIPIEIREGWSSVAIIFIESIMTAMLSGVEKKIKKEVDELVPENFLFFLEPGTTDWPNARE